MRRALPLLLIAAPALALADLPVVEAVEARAGPAGWTFTVTVRHADEGWDHYADGWSVLTLEGEALGHRTLHHPHVEEQPFTRSLTGVTVPDGVTEVVVRAHDGVHGWGEGMVVPLPR
jgi:hypothetical protein